MIVPIDLRSTRNIVGDGRKKILVYGRSGVGKTYFAGGFPKPIFLAFEEGMLTLAEKDIPYLQINHWKQELEEAYGFLNSAGARKRYKTVVIDSLTELQLLSIEYVLEKAGKEVMEIQHWGRVLDSMRKFMREMTDLPYDVVFICREADERDERTGIVRTKPAMSGKFAEEAPAYVDICMRLHVEEPRTEADTTRTRYGMFQPTARYVAKDRTGALPSVMKDPTAKKILARIDRKFATQDEKE